MSDKFIYDELDGITFTKKPLNKFVPGPSQVVSALSRLATLPNPNHPDLDEPEKYVESPWRVIDAPTVDPNVWDTAKQVIVPLADLTATDQFLKRKRVKKHIDAMGQALTPFRSLPLVAEIDDTLVIIDGHHRLMAWWLLGQDKQTVWKVEI